MTPPAAQPDAAMAPYVLCVCRDPASRTLLDRRLEAGQVYGSVVEALLAGARRSPEAVVIQFAFNGHTRRDEETLAAFRRAHNGVPVYGLVPAEAEPAARRLVGKGLADYFILPKDMRRLLSVLRRGPQAVAAAPALPAPAVAGSDRLFEATCRLADLALAQPLPLFSDGARIIVETCAAGRGCAFRWSEAESHLELTVAVGGDDALGGGDPATIRSAAVRCLQTGESLALRPGTPGLPPEGLLCLPVRDEQSGIGVVCAAGVGRPTIDHRQAEALAGVLARLYRAANRREEYARLALRDVETGLLKADPFLTYVESRIAQASDRQSELALILLEPSPGSHPDAAESPARLGLAVKQALATGWEAGRLGTTRYAVAMPTGVSGSERVAPSDAGESVVRRLAGAGPLAGASGSVRTAVAHFPGDGETAHDLVAAAERRLGQPTEGRD